MTEDRFRRSAFMPRCVIPAVAMVAGSDRVQRLGVKFGAVGGDCGLWNILTFRRLSMVLFAFFIMHVHRTAIAQTPAPDTWQYRRGFVFESDLPSLGMDRFVPVPLEELEVLLQQAQSPQPSVPVSPIQKVVLVASLIGEDLVSDWSIVQFEKGGNHSTFEFQPLSLALRQASPVFRASTVEPNDFRFRCQPDGKVLVQPNEQGLFGFAWTLHGKSDLTGKSIPFQFDFPMSPQSVLILQLPPSWRVTAADHVVYQGGPTEQKLLDAWPVASLLGSPQENFWVVQFGGVSRCSFQLQRISEPSVARLPRVVASIEEQFEVGPAGLFLQSSWRLDDSTSFEESLTLNLSQRIKVRSISWEGQPIPWRSNGDHTILIEPPSSMVIPDPFHAQTGEPLRRTLSIEAIAVLPSVSQDAIGVHFELPSIWIEGGYALQGRSRVISLADLKVVDLRSAAEEWTVNRADQGEWEFRWRGLSKPRIATLQRSVVQAKAECLTLWKRIHNQMSCTALMRVEGLPGPNGILRLHVPVLWVVDSVLARAGKTDQIHGFSSNIDSGGIEIEYGNLETGTPLVFELRYHFGLHETEEGDFVAPQLPRLSLHDGEVEEVLGIEISENTRLKVSPALLRARRSRSNLVDWQQREITSETGHWFFAFSEQAYPEITILSQPSLYSTSTDVSVVRQGNVFQCNYRIRCAIESGGLPRLQAELPFSGQGAVKWSQLWQQSELPLQAVLVQKGSETTNEVWQIFPTQLQSNSIEVVARMELELRDRISIPVISFPLAANQTATVSIDETLKLAKNFDPVRFLLRSTSEDPRLSVGGTHFELDPARSNSIEVEFLTNSLESRFFGEQFVRYEMLTTGEIMARSHWRLNTLSLDPVRVDVPVGWRFRKAWIDGIQAQPRFDPRETNSVHIPIRASSHWSGVVELEVEMERDTVLDRPQDLELGVPTIEARGLTVRGVLWLPPGIMESGHYMDRWSRLTEFLRFWNWHRHLWSNNMMAPSLFADGTRQVEAPILLPQKLLKDGILESVEQETEPGSSGQPVTSASESPLVFQVRLEYENLELALRWLVLLIAMSSAAMLRVRNWAWAFLVPIAGAGLALIVGGRNLSMIEVGCLGYLLGWALTVGRRLFVRRKVSEWSSTAQSPASGVRGGSHSFVRVSALLLVANISGSCALAQSPSFPVNMPQTARPVEGASSAPVEKPSDELKPTIFDVLIPMDSAGNLAGKVGYIPQDVYDRLVGNRRASTRTPGYDIASARYQVTFPASILELSPPSLSLHYELDVLDPSKPIAFPMRSSEARWTRFVVDDREVLPGFRLSHAGDQLVWLPDQAGRMKIRIDVIPRVNTLDMQSSLKVSVPQIASAQLDVAADSVASLQVVSMGQVLNPQVGRYLAHLGPVEAIELTWTSKDRDRLQRRTADNTIDTWLQLSDSRVEAYTRIVLQDSRASPSIIEVECLSEWQPLGVVWGHARLLETSLGSSLARRRYRLLVDPVVATSSESPQEIVLSTRWIPANESAVNLGVPFVEVVSRRIANRVLAIAATERSVWQIQGIASWPKATRTVVEPPSEWKSPNESLQILQLPENSPSPILRRVKHEERIQFRPAMEYAISSSTIESRIVLPFTDLPLTQHELRFRIAKGATRIRAELDGRIQPHFTQTQFEGYDELLVRLADHNAASQLHLVVEWPLNRNEWTPLPNVIPLTGEMSECRYSIVSKLDVHVQFENLPSSPSQLKSVRWQQWEKVHDEWSDSTQMKEERIAPNRSPSSPASPIEGFAFHPIRYRVEASFSPVSGKILTRITRNDTSWNIDYSIDIQTEEKRCTAFLEVPASLLASLDADCPFHVVSASSEAKAYIAIQPYETGANRYRCRVVGQLTNTELESSAIPLLDILGAPDVEQKMIVPSRIGNQTANWKGSGVRLLSAEEIGDAFRLENEEVAYVATTSTSQLRIASLDAISMQKQEVVANYRIAPYPAQVAVDCEFWVYSAGKHFIEVELPQRFQLLGLRINNQIMAAPELRDDRLQLPLPMSELPSLIRLYGIVKGTKNEPFQDNLQIPTIRESSTVSYVQIRSSRVEDRLVTFPGRELERTAFRPWQSSKRDRLQSMLSRGRIQLGDQTSGEGESWRKIWFPVLARLGGTASYILGKVDAISDVRSAEYFDEEKYAVWTNELAGNLPGHSGEVLEEEIVSFFMGEESVGELQWSRSQQSESYAWLTIAICLLISMLVIIASVTTTPHMREFLRFHPWTLYVIVGMLFLFLLPWKWIGGAVMFMAAMVMLQTIHHRRTRRFANLK